MDNELYHWGVLGQKWGKRNYQNEDGSLTPEGRIHYGVGQARKESVFSSVRAKHTAEKAKKQAEKQAKKEAEEKKKAEEKERNKLPQQMTNEELTNYIVRSRAEKEALQLRSDINKLTPQRISKGEAFIKSFEESPLGKQITQAVIQSGQDALKKWMDYQFKSGEEDQTTKLKKEAEITKYKSQIAANKLAEKVATENYNKKPDKK